MEVISALRRVKRQFGDEYNVVIIDQDIFDWIHDAELDIIRSTSDNDLTITIPSVSFPVNIPDRVNVKRLSVDGLSLPHIALPQIDMMEFNTTPVGGTKYWYYQGGQVFLWPTVEATDTSTVDVTYARVPSQMTVVAPYLNFSPTQSGSTPVKYATVPTDNDWKLSSSVNVSMELSIDSLQRNFNLLTCGVGDGTDPSTLHFAINYVNPLTSSLQFLISDATTVITTSLTFRQPIIPGENFGFRIIYNPNTGTSNLYKINVISGQETLQDTNIETPLVKQSAAFAGLIVGNIDTTTVPTHGASMRVRKLELQSSVATGGAPVFLFDGMVDLGDLVLPSTVITTSSGHTMTTTAGVVTPAKNEFTVPEVFHEDIVKYCLAKAHNKNQNFRAAEAEMEQYDRRVSTRRNEAQAPETAIYKIPDPNDYEDYDFSNY
jgi:hypothetical protein